MILLGWRVRRRWHNIEELRGICMTPFGTAAAVFWVVTWRAESIDLSAKERKPQQSGLNCVSMLCLVRYFRLKALRDFSVCHSVAEREGRCWAVAIESYEANDDAPKVGASSKSTSLGPPLPPENTTQHQRKTFNCFSQICFLCPMEYSH